MLFAKLIHNSSQRLPWRSLGPPRPPHGTITQPPGCMLSAPRLPTLARPPASFLGACPWGQCVVSLPSTFALLSCAKDQYSTELYIRTRTISTGVWFDVGRVRAVQNT